MSHGEYSHIEIPFDNERRARTFFENVFGWQFREMEGFPGYLLYTAGPGDLGGGLGKRGEGAGNAIRNYIDVDSVDEALGKVKANGGTVLEPKTPVGDIGWYAVVTTSEGDELAIYETKAG